GDTLTAPVLDRALEQEARALPTLVFDNGPERIEPLPRFNGVFVRFVPVAVHGSSCCFGSAQANAWEKLSGGPAGRRTRLRARIRRPVVAVLQPSERVF